MTIRDEAIAAFNAVKQDAVSDAQQHLVDTLLTNSVDGKSLISPNTLTVVHEDHFNDLFIFSDGDINLAVSMRDEDEQIYVVEDEEGWTRKSDNLVDLVALGEYLVSQVQ